MKLYYTKTMAIFSIPSDRVFVGPRGGLYRVEQGRKIYDIAPAKPVVLESAERERVFTDDYEEESGNAPGFWGVIWFLVCAPFRFMGFCLEHGGPFWFFVSIALVMSCVSWTLQALSPLFWHFAGMLEAAHFIG